jgi:hypothetical protein
VKKRVKNMNWTKSRKVFLAGCRVVQPLVPAKCKRQIILSLLVVVLLGSNAQARTGDWRAVENLQPGAGIMVKTQYRYPCIFVSATDDELSCDFPQRWRLGLPLRRTFPRREIREVRKEPNQAKDAWIGAGIGAGAGAVAAAAGSRIYPGFHAFFGGLAGAGGGALVGAMIPVFQVVFHGGKLVYRR